VTPLADPSLFFRPLASTAVQVQCGEGCGRCSEGSRGEQGTRHAGTVQPRDAHPTPRALLHTGPAGGVFAARLGFSSPPPTYRPREMRGPVRHSASFCVTTQRVPVFVPRTQPCYRNQPRSGGARPRSPKRAGRRKHVSTGRGRTARGTDGGGDTVSRYRSSCLSRLDDAANRVPVFVPRTQPCYRRHPARGGGA